MLAPSLLIGMMAQGGVATFPSLTSPKIFGIGDSITQFGNFNKGASNQSRAATGIITGTVTANGALGTPNVGLVNMSDTSFEVIARNNSNSTSTLGATAGTANAVAIYTSNTTVASATALANAALIHMERFTWRGFITNLISKFNGGLEFIGQLGHGGLLAPLTSQITYAATVGADLFTYMGGTNNAKAGGATAAGVFAAIKTDLDQIRALNGGLGVPTLVQAIPPLGNGAIASWASANINIIGDPNSPALGFTGGTNTTSANYLLKQECLAHPTVFLFVDTFTPMCDASVPSAPQLYSTMTSDLTHPLTNAMMLAGAAGYAAASPYITAPIIVARASTDVGTTVNGHPRVAARGPWVSTTGGNFTTGGSGTLPPGWTAGRFGTTTGTIVCSIVDPGDGFGLQVQGVVTSAAAGDGGIIYPYGSSGSSLATMGITSATDNAEYCFAAEVSWSGGNAYGLSLLQLQALSNSSGTYAQASVGENNTAENAGVWPDSGTMIFRTGWIQASNSLLTSVALTLNINSLTNVGSMTVKIRQVTVLKR